MPAGNDNPKVPFFDRVRMAFLKDSLVDSPPPGVAAGTPDSIPELEDLVKRANDKERLIGVLGGPVAAALALIITNVLIQDDPAQYLKNGLKNTAHVSISLYHEVEVVLFLLALGMVATGLLRKRIVLGVLMALYGLTVFNLHYWGFGIPFLMGGAWLLVRSYRLQRSLKDATGESPAFYGPGSSSAVRAKSNKRYTPPRARARRAQRPTNGV